MQIKFKIDDKKFQKELDRLSSKKEISRAVLYSLHKVAIEFRKDMITWTPQDTRELLDSWEIHYKNDLTIEVGMNTVYAMYQDMGMRRDGTHVIRNRPAGGKTGYFSETFDEGAKKYFVIFEKYFFERLLG